MELNKLIGFFIVNLIYIEKKSEYEILSTYVDNQYRKLEYASYLINAFITSSYTKTIEKITLEVSKSNTAAINLYKKNK